MYEQKTRGVLAKFLVFFRFVAVTDIESSGDITARTF